jgi:hypothetical protein
VFLHRPYHLLIEDDKEKFQVFDKNGLYLAGKNNPKAERIQTDNEIRMKWNRQVDRAMRWSTGI